MRPKPPKSLVTPVLEKQLQTKLNLAGVKCSRCLSEVAAGDPVREVRSRRGTRQEEIRMVKRVEELSPELRLEALRDLDVLEDGLVGIEVSRSNKGIAAQVSVAARARRREESGMAVAVGRSKTTCRKEPIGPSLFAEVQIVAVVSIWPVVCHAVQVEVSTRIAQPGWIGRARHKRS